MKLKRSERIVVMTEYLLNNPNKLIPLTYFVSKFNQAKSAGTGKNLTFDNKLSIAGTASLNVEVTVAYKLNNPVNKTVQI